MGKLVIQDLTDSTSEVKEESPNVRYTRLEKPEAKLGGNLNTIEDARRWLLHPSNWFEGRTYIIKWDGLVPTICKEHAERLVREHWDTGMYEVVVRHQLSLKRRGKDRDDPEPMLGEE
jgi:hypothetical protein